MVACVSCVWTATQRWRKTTCVSWSPTRASSAVSATESCATCRRQLPASRRTPALTTTTRTPVSPATRYATRRRLQLICLQTEPVTARSRYLSARAVNTGVTSGHSCLRPVNSPVSTYSACVSNKCITVRKVAAPLRELTCHMGSHSVTCHPAELTFPPLPQPKLVLDSATPEGCKAELT